MQQTKFNKMSEKFDFQTWEQNNKKFKGKGNLPDNYYLQDGSMVMLAEPELYITPAKPAFYVIYKEFYENESVKRKGRYFGLSSNILPIGIWWEFDENGNLTKEVNEDTKFGKFSYDDVLKFLNKKGDFDIYTGRNRENLEIINYYHNANSFKKLWVVQIKKGEPYPIANLPEDKGEKYAQDGKYYYLDGDTGEEIKYKDLVKYKEIIPNFEEEFPSLAK